MLDIPIPNSDFVTLNPATVNLAFQVVVCFGFGLV